MSTSRARPASRRSQCSSGVGDGVRWTKPLLPVASGRTVTSVVAPDAMLAAATPLARPLIAVAQCSANMPAYPHSGMASAAASARIRPTRLRVSTRSDSFGSTR
ncbi:hypothetical protein FrCorBMG51_23710 [Protofrankia coriariae]|uniref:Uncharacterized protein n=1 Tax=Protofrankia coriariae TaxID=1562887 RepID=A0ABR5EYR1_9ACTN|nr:hypothetical protein FrCorBMG51_23710 [Protofrankia coriariae]